MLRAAPFALLPPLARFLHAMLEKVRVEEYSVATPEQRRSMADSIAEELEKGCSVLCAISVSQRQDDQGDILTTRVAVYYSDPNIEVREGEAEAVATATADEGATAPSIVEDIMSIPPTEQPEP